MARRAWGFPTGIVNKLKENTNQMGPYKHWIGSMESLAEKIHLPLVRALGFGYYLEALHLGSFGLRETISPLTILDGKNKKMQGTIW